jgi:hypothetical protein
MLKTEYTEQSLSVLKTVIMFVAEYGSAPKEDGGGKKPCASPAGMRKCCGAGTLNWSTF